MTHFILIARVLLVGLGAGLVGCVYGGNCVDGANRDESGVCRFRVDGGAVDGGVDSGLIDASEPDAGGDDAGAADAGGDDAGPDAGDAGIAVAVADVAVGRSHLCVLTDEALPAVLCMGDNAYGQLGVPSAGLSSDVFVEVVLRDAPAAVSGAGDTVCVLTATKKILCWGRNDHGQVGSGNGEDFVGSPELVGGDGTDLQWAGVAAGVYTVCGLEQNDAEPVRSPFVRCWGSNSNLQTGDSDNTGTGDRRLPAARVSLQLADGTGGPNLWAVGHVAVGDSFACAYTAEDQTGDMTGGGVFCWGNGAGFRLGSTVGTTTFAIRVPEALTSVHTVADHACATRSDQPAVCWGANGTGQTAPGEDVPEAGPTSVGVTASPIVAGAGYTCGLNRSGEVVCFGGNAHGELGRGVTSPSEAPAVTDPPLLAKVLRIGAAGPMGGRTCAINGDGELYCWGAGAAHPERVPLFR